MAETIRVLAPDKSTLMEIAELGFLDGQLTMRGKIMGAMPLKATIAPSELRKLIGLLGWRSVFRVGIAAVFKK